MIYEFKSAEKVAQKKVGDTLLSDVVTRVDIWIKKEGSDIKIPHSLMLDEPTVESFTALGDLTQEQLVSWVTADFTEEFETHMANLIAERENPVDSTVSAVIF